ncbi:CCHC-type domain-containing protein [Trichonephila clavipes]|nr:CCHC-type domain-containing protein [Trichonephila clavipes]
MAVSSYQIKPLESSNYATWSTDVRFLLHEKNCFEIVAGKETAPDSKEENRREFSGGLMKPLNIKMLCWRRECRNGTAASSGTANRRSRTYRKGPELRQHPSVSSPIGSSVTSDEFNYNAFRGGRRDRNYSFKDRNDLSSKLRKTLISGPMLDLNGLKFIGENGKIKVYAGNKQIFKANLEQGLYYAYPGIEPKYASSIEKSVKIKGKPNDLMIWHERFGHVKVDYILKTSRLNAVRGLPEIKKPFNFECEPCRTVIDGARTVLSESGLDKSFWPEAVLYFVHVWNRLCHSGQTLTPIELYIGIKLSIRHLRPFGSTLYMGTPRPLRGKLDPKAKKGILVGFALGTRGYRVWIPEDSKVIETSNIRFQKPQQSNGGAVLVSPNLKFSDYEVFENGDDDTDDERVNNIPISLPQDSDSKN